ncbi:MAG: LacI family transcriptional regulator [Gammaproteobacteria bacterium]|jgi:LacI family transcriptional regulator
MDGAARALASRKTRTVGAIVPTVDNAEAARSVTRYLIEIWHKDIAMVAGVNNGNDRAIERVNGVRMALEEHGLSFAPGYLMEKLYQIAEGRLAAKQLLDLQNPLTAIMCGNTILALGVLFEYIASGIRIKKDWSVISITIENNNAPPLKQ